MAHFFSLSIILMLLLQSFISSLSSISLLSVHVLMNFFEIVDRVFLLKCSSVSGSNSFSDTHLSSTFYFYVSFLPSLLYQFSWFLSVYHFPFEWGKFCRGQHFSGDLYWWGMATADSFNLGISLRPLSYQKHCALCLSTQYHSGSSDPLPL